MSINPEAGPSFAVYVPPSLVNKANSSAATRGTNFVDGLSLPSLPIEEHVLRATRSPIFKIALASPKFNGSIKIRSSSTSALTNNFLQRFGGALLESSTTLYSLRSFPKGSYR